MNCVVLCGGGTAGHIIPALALTGGLKKYYGRIVFVGSENGMEKKLAENAGIEFFGISCAKLLRKFTPKNLLIPFKLFKGIKQAENIFKEIKPSVVFSKGGYVSLPAVLAAHRLKIPVVSHESDFSPGLATKIASRYSACVCASFESCAKTFKNKGVYTKSPIRESILSGNKENFLNGSGFDKNKPVILFMGGSSGARFLNVLLRNCLNGLLKSYNVIHITGKGNLSGINLKGYKQIEFTENIADIFAAADYAVCRSGSNTVFEMLCLKKPMLLIPLPKGGSSRGDQVENAEFLVKIKCAHMVNQTGLNENTLISEIKKLTGDSREIIKTISMHDFSSGTQNVIEQVLKHSLKN